MTRAAHLTAATRPASPLRCVGRFLKKIASRWVPSVLGTAESVRNELLRRCSLEGLWDWDLRTDKVHYSLRFRELLGYSAEEPLRRYQIAFHPEDTERMRLSMRRLFENQIQIDEEFRLRCGNGEYRWFRGRGHAVWDNRGRPLRFAGSITDIHDYKLTELRLLHLADHDVLTGLPNRRAFLHRICQAIARGRSFGQSLAVLFIDLDRFKQINDVLGHDTGNEVLREAARRIRVSVRDDDTVARLGGDEFAVLLQDIESEARACAIADRIRAEINRSFVLAEREVYLSASIGIAAFPRDGRSGEELLKRSDLAMYQVKKNGRDNHQFYSPESENRISRDLDIETRLRRALANGEFELHYQPQVAFSSGEINSVEALLRWNNPELGWVSPGQFIPLAEEIGLIQSIGAWVLETACAQAKAWQVAGLRPVRMCVNVSPLQLDKRLIETVSRVLGETTLSPSSLELEITESVMVGKDLGAEAVLQSLRALGVGFAIDDFGTGYATFDYLKRFPVNTLKVDQSFVRGVCDDSNDVAIVDASVALARSFGLRVVAEGVETAEQHGLLRRLGCNDCQGYYTFRPLPRAVLEGLLSFSGDGGSSNCAGRAPACRLKEGPPAT